MLLASEHYPEHEIEEDAVLHKVFANTMQPSKVLPYYFKAIRDFDPESVTITTLITFDRYPIFSKLVTNYQGPISVSIHINDDESRDENLSKLHDMYEANPYMREFVDVHVVVDKFDRQFNMWRNVARFFARSNYFMMLDGKKNGGVEGAGASHHQKGWQRFPFLDSCTIRIDALVVFSSHSRFSHLHQPPAPPFLGCGGTTGHAIRSSSCSACVRVCGAR